MYQCSDCSKIFKTVSNVYRHKRESCKFRPNVSVLKLSLSRCKECDIWYVKQKFRQHLRLIVHKKKKLVIVDS